MKLCIEAIGINARLVERSQSMYFVIRLIGFALAAGAAALYLVHRFIQAMESTYIRADVEW